jgi:hypothetical protein
MVLGTLARLPPSSMLVLALAPPLSLIALIGAMSWSRKGIRIVSYEKAAAALGCAALGLVLLRQPVMPVLDIAMLGVGTFLALGRVGCLCASCCHGRRAAWGIRYSWAHAAGGYPARWVGVRVFPVQILDSLATATAVAVGTVVQLGPHAVGTPLVAWLCVYGVLRFPLEFIRGDDARPYLLGASEAQWTSAVTTAGAALYRPSPGTMGVAFLLGLGLLALVFARVSGRWAGWRFGRRIWLFSAAHLAEVDRTLERLIADGAAVVTREGVAMSLGSRSDGAFDLKVSLERSSLSLGEVSALGRQLGREWTVVSLPDEEHPWSLVVVRQLDPESLSAS